MNLEKVVQEYLDQNNIDCTKAYGITTRKDPSFPFVIQKENLDEKEDKYNLLILDMVSPILNVKNLTKTLLKGKNMLSDDGLMVFDFIEETRPMLTVAKKMESWRGNYEEEVFCYTLIDIASALTAMGMQIVGIEKAGNLGKKQVVAVFTTKA